MIKQRFPISWDEVPIVIDLNYVADFILKVNLRYLQNLAHRGDFPAYKVGKYWRINKNDLIDYLKK